MSGSNPWDFDKYAQQPPGGASGPPGQGGGPATGGAFGGGASGGPGPYGGGQPGQSGGQFQGGQGAWGGPPAPQFGGDPFSGTAVLPPDQAGAAVFGGPVAMGGSGSVAIGRPPVIWLLGCLVVVIASAVVAFLLGDAGLWAIVAWVAAGPIAIGLLAAFLTFDTRARAKPIYDRQPWTRAAYWVMVVLCLAAVIFAAWKIALWTGRL